MKTNSPLRYPGGKAALAGLLSSLRKLNHLGGIPVAEPFAGGAGASLGLLFEEETREIAINDADPAIFALWWSLVNRPAAFDALIRSRPIEMAEWRRQRAIYRDGSRQSRLRRGFAAFYLNRCNRSGIIGNGGPIGGIKQTGPWKLGARFNRQDLRARCGRVAEYRTRIRVSGVDGIEFIEGLDSSSLMLFIDPPYFVKGPTLYLNALDEQYHRRLANTLRSIEKAPWVLTYDDCPEVRDLYRGWASIRPFSLRYAAAARRSGREVLITPRWMRVPSTYQSQAVSW